MDNLLTPGKIQRLINLAEDRSFTGERVMLTDEDLRRMVGQASVMKPRSPTYETSSGILDIDRMEAFGDSIASISLSKSTAFNPGEMTGRSTGATETSSCLMPHPSETYAATLGGFISRMQQQTNEVNDVLRHSLASNYSFHSKRDLTADEVSLISREAPLPVPNNPNQASYYLDNVSINSSNLSVGAYFKNKCQSFGKLLENTDSPDNTNLTGNMNNMNSTNMMPSISEVSSSMPYEVNTDPKSVVIVDDTLDTVPVRQPAKIPPPKSPRRSKLPLSTTINSNTFELPKQTAKKCENTPKIPEKPKFTQDLNPTVFTAHKSFMCSSKPADVVLKNLHSSFVPVSDEHGANDTDSLENSVSISKIADYLGRQSEISVTEVMNLNKKKPVKEIPMEPQNKGADQEMRVTYLKDTKQMGATSTLTASSLTTVLDKPMIDIPNVIVTEPTPKHQIIDLDDEDEKPMKRSQSPSKSPTTLSTVRDCSSFRSRSSGESPNNSKGKPKISMLPSSKVLYKELDKSVDWQDVFQEKLIRCRSQARMSIGAREGWADIVAHYVEGYVGVSCPASISVTTHTDSWLTAILKFEDLPNSADLNIELSRVPILLSPGKCEKFSCQITANIEMVTALPFTVTLKDASVDGVIEQKGELPVKFVAPSIKTKSIDGKDIIIFPALQETSTFTKTLVLTSDCPVDLLLKLSIAEGDSIFAIKSVQEIDRSDVDKALSEMPSEEQMSKKSRSKSMSLQLCRLTPYKALRVVVAYVAPMLKGLNISESEAMFNGLLKVNLITNNILLKRIKLVGSVGVAVLVARVQGDSVHLSKEPTTITLTNTGTALGLWALKFVYSDNALPFKITPSRFDIPPGGSKTITMAYTGHPDSFVQATLKFKEATSGHVTTFDLTGGSKPKQFPIKTNHTLLSWVRHGRKEISLKNNTDKRVHLQCNITGEGFYMDLVEKTDCLVLSFEPQQCKILSVVFRASTSMPSKAVLHLIDKAGSTRKIKLFGCNSDESVRWSGGIMTYESTALKQAPPRTPVDLELYNKAHMPAFLVATVKFHLQYLTVEATSRLTGSPTVIAGRARHTITLHVDWNKVDKQRRDGATTATSLATVTILTGAECTRRRILKVVKDESATDEPDLSLLPDYLRVLAGHFEGEDPNVDHLFEDFDETKASLTELMSGLHELTAHIELPHDIGHENTIIICDDTMVNHHTLVE